MEEVKYLIPEESIDAIMNNVSVLREIENDLRTIFTKNHYLEVLMPSFEYVDLYNDMDIGIEEEKMFQFINHEGKRVALRTDFTVPLARLYSSQNEQGEKRYCYFGKVYRKEKRHKGRSSEFFQAGVELLGKDGFDGDIECLTIIQQTIQCLKLKEIKIEISSAKFYKRLCELVNDDSFVKMVSNTYKEAYGCAEKIGEYILNNNEYKVNDDELVYLTMHIQRVVSVDREKNNR